MAKHEDDEDAHEDIDEETPENDNTEEHDNDNANDSHDNNGNDDNGSDSINKEKECMAQDNGNDNRMKEQKNNINEERKTNIETSSAANFDKQEQENGTVLDIKELDNGAEFEDELDIYGIQTWMSIKMKELWINYLLEMILITIIK